MKVPYNYLPFEFAKSKKIFSNWKTNYSRTYDLNNNDEELISETLGLEYTGTGYMLE